MERIGETFRTNSVDDGALCGAKPSLVCRADAAYVSGLRKCLALNSLALNLVAVECPPIFLMDRLTLLFLLVRVGAITLFVMLSCPSQIPGNA